MGKREITSRLPFSAVTNADVNVGMGTAEGRGGCTGEGDPGLAGVDGALSIASISVAMLEVSASLIICFWKFSKAAHWRDTCDLSKITEKIHHTVYVYLHEASLRDAFGFNLI